MYVDSCHVPSDQEIIDFQTLHTARELERDPYCMLLYNKTCNTWKGNVHNTYVNTMATKRGTEIILK